jgi:hypothetical protein
MRKKSILTCGWSSEMGKYEILGARDLQVKGDSRRGKASPPVVSGGRSHRRGVKALKLVGWVRKSPLGDFYLLYEAGDHYLVSEE